MENFQVKGIVIETLEKFKVAIKTTAERYLPGGDARGTSGFSEEWEEKEE